MVSNFRKEATFTILKPLILVLLSTSSKDTSTHCIHTYRTRTHARLFWSFHKVILYISCSTNTTDIQNSEDWFHRGCSGSIFSLLVSLHLSLEVTVCCRLFRWEQKWMSFNQSGSSLCQLAPGWIAVPVNSTNYPTFCESWGLAGVLSHVSALAHL